MKHEMTLLHTMEPNRNVLSRHLLFVTIYDDDGAFQCVIGHTTSLYLVMQRKCLSQTSVLKTFSLTSARLQ